MPIIPHPCTFNSPVPDLQVGLLRQGCGHQHPKAGIGTVYPTRTHSSDTP